MENKFQKENNKFFKAVKLYFSLFAGIKILLFIAFMSHLAVDNCILIATEMPAVSRLQPYAKQKVIIPCSQYVKLNFNPSPKSNQVFNPSKLKHYK